MYDGHVPIRQEDRRGHNDRWSIVDDRLVTDTSSKAVEQFFTRMVSLDIKYLDVVSKFLGLIFMLDDK